MAPDGTDTKILHTTEFKRGKGKFEFNAWEETVELTEHAKDYPYILTTNRELEHYNCGAMTRRTANEQILQDDYLMINPNDAKAHLIKEGDYMRKIVLFSEFKCKNEVKISMIYSAV